MKVSRSWLGLASLMHQNKSRKFGAMAVRLGALRFTISHTGSPKFTALKHMSSCFNFPTNVILHFHWDFTIFEFSFGGKDNLHARQMKFLILFWQWSCQMDFHNDVALVLLELSPTSTLVSCLWLIRYALWTEKTPLAVADHTL